MENRDSRPPHPGQGQRVTATGKEHRMADDTRDADRDERQAITRAMRDYLDAHNGVLVTPVDHTSSGR